MSNITVQMHDISSPSCTDSNFKKSTDKLAKYYLNHFHLLQAQANIYIWFT